MRETDIVERIRQSAARGFQSRSLVRGIGDDCAIFRPDGSADLVFTSDFVLEGRHFTLDTHTAADVGHKALARSLSDLAAMGSEPAFCLVSLAIPARLGAAWVARFYKGLMGLAKAHKTALAGGDLAQFDKVVADVICCGRVPRGKALLRGGARVGDAIYVTGELGASAHGFATRRGKAWRRHLRPSPRVAVGLALGQLGAHAAIDLSDGLSLDLQRLCRESKVAARLDGEIPIARNATLEEALHGGEDYELLFTIPGGAAVPARIGGVRVTRIGQIVRGRSGEIRLAGKILKAKGFDHFK
jgi:thiamine-monophosphate kinase